MFVPCNPSLTRSPNSIRLAEIVSDVFAVSDAPLRLLIAENRLLCGSRQFELRAHFLSSVGCGFCPDDVGIGACAVAVVGAYPVVIERIGGESGHVSTGDVADIQILVSWYVSDKRSACGDVQSITRRTANTRPVRTEAVGSHIAVI